MIVGIERIGRGGRLGYNGGVESTRISCWRERGFDGGSKSDTSQDIVGGVLTRSDGQFPAWNLIFSTVTRQAALPPVCVSTTIVKSMRERISLLADIV